MIYDIYYLSGKNGEIFYVGMTSLNLLERLHGHKTQCVIGTDSEKKTKKMLEHWDYLEINEIEQIEADDSFEARRLEVYWINQFKEWGFPICNHLGLMRGRPDREPREPSPRRKSVSILEATYLEAKEYCDATGRFFSVFIDRLIADKLKTVREEVEEVKRVKRVVGL